MSFTSVVTGQSSASTTESRQTLDNAFVDSIRSSGVGTDQNHPLVNSGVFRAQESLDKRKDIRNDLSVVYGTSDTSAISSPVLYKTILINDNIDCK